MKKIFNKKKEGFTLVEAIIAIAVLVTGVTAPIYVASVSLFNATDAEYEISAYYFAQEGIEVIRYVRDTNIINSRPWLDNLVRCDPTNGCNVLNPIGIVDQDNDLANCGGCSILRQSNDLFGGVTGGHTDTGFDRNIRIDEVDPGREAVVEVTIEWTKRGKAHTYILKETMFNWSTVGP